MASNPIPNQPVIVHDGECAVSHADPGGIDTVLALELLKLQAGIARIGPKQAIGALCVALNVRRQLTEKPPECPRSPRVDQRRSSRSSVSPAASS